MRDKVTEDRWLLAHEQEKRSIGDTEDIKEWLRIRRHTWPNLINYLRSELTFKDSSRILEIGGGPTSIFLAIAKGERYMADPNWDNIVRFLPFIREVAEYKGVTFISDSIENVSLDRKVDFIFTINALDHMGDLTSTINKIDELLEPSGYLVMIVDCYADAAVRNIIRFFDVDLPHPHHFLKSDVLQLFAHYQFVKQDDGIGELINDYSFRGQQKAIAVYRIDKLIKRMWMILKSDGKESDIMFISKYILCYSLSLLVAIVNKSEKPIHPLKKERLFIFRK